MLRKPCFPYLIRINNGYFMRCASGMLVWINLTCLSVVNIYENDIPEIQLMFSTKLYFYVTFTHINHCKGFNFKRFFRKSGFLSV